MKQINLISQILFLIADFLDWLYPPVYQYPRPDMSNYYCFYCGHFEENLFVYGYKHKETGKAHLAVDFVVSRQLHERYPFNPKKVDRNLIVYLTHYGRRMSHVLGIAIDHLHDEELEAPVNGDDYFEEFFHRRRSSLYELADSSFFLPFIASQSQFVK